MICLSRDGLLLARMYDIHHIFSVQAGDGGDAPAPRPDWLPEGCEMLADGEYDAIVMGTGLKEAIMSGLLSTLGMKVCARAVCDAAVGRGNFGACR